MAVALASLIAQGIAAPTAKSLSEPAYEVDDVYGQAYTKGLKTREYCAVDLFAPLVSQTIRTPHYPLYRWTGGISGTQVKVPVLTSRISRVDVEIPPVLGLGQPIMHISVFMRRP